MLQLEFSKFSNGKISLWEFSTISLRIFKKKYALIRFDRKRRVFDNDPEYLRLVAHII